MFSRQLQSLNCQLFLSYQETSIAVLGMPSGLGFQSHVKVETTFGHGFELVVDIFAFDSLPSRCRLAAPWFNRPSCHATLETSQPLACVQLFPDGEDLPLYRSAITMPITSYLPIILTVNFWRTLGGSPAKGFKINAWEVMLSGMLNVCHRAFLCAHQN